MSDEKDAESPPRRLKPSSSPSDDSGVLLKNNDSIGCRINYLVETPNIIRAYLNKSMLLESATRFMTAKFVHHSLENTFASKYDWDINIETFKVEISNPSRERLLSLDLCVDAYADALAALMIMDHLPVLTLFLDSRISCILKIKHTCLFNDLSSVIDVFCQIIKIIQVTLAQLGQLFIHLSPCTTPLLRTTLLTSLNSPASQLFRGIPDPHSEIVLWTPFRDSLTALFDQTRNFYYHWLYDCVLHHILSDVNGNYLIDVFEDAQQLSLAEEKMRATLDDKQVLAGSLEWLNSVCGFKVISPWKTTSQLVLGPKVDLWNDFFEHVFVGCMESIIVSKFDKLCKFLNVEEWIVDITNTTDETDYPGNEANRISSRVYTHFENVLEELFIFFQSPNMSKRREDLAPCFQIRCYSSIYTINITLGYEMDRLYDETMEIRNNQGEFVMPRDSAILRILSIQRLLVAFQKHSKQIAMILGSPKLWVTKAMNHIPSNSSVDSPAAYVGGSLKEQTSLLDSARASDSLSSELEVLNMQTKNFIFTAHDLWMCWVSEKLSTDLSHNLMQDDNLCATTPLRGWEETVVKQELSAQSTSEIKISLPSMPSKYVTFFLNQACVEIRRAGGHILGESTLQSFASTCLERVIDIYGDFISSKEVFDARVSKKGVLQIQLDLVFCADILSGADLIGSEDVSGAPEVGLSYGKRQDKSQTKKAISRERIYGLISGLAERLDRKDWLMYEPFLWANEKQWYQHHAADFEFFCEM